MAGWPDMDWASIVPAAITGVVGLAGIVGSILSARLTSRSASRNLELSISAEDKRAYTAEKRRIYAAFNAAIENLWIVVTSSEDFATDPGRFHYNQAVTLLWSAYFEVSLIASGDVSELALDITTAMNQFATDLRKNRAGDEPSGFDEKRGRLITVMRAELGEGISGN
jgi:hypothetical protein